MKLALVLCAQKSKPPGSDFMLKSMEERILLQELLQRWEMVDALMFLLVSSAKRPKRHQSTAPLLLTAEVGVRVGCGMWEVGGADGVGRVAGVGL